MAEAASRKEEDYDVFLVHSSEDNTTAHVINAALQKTGFKTYAHYKEGVEFPAGRPVFDNIIHAVNCSKIILVLLTKQALRSQWVTFEVLMGLEKSHREENMCVRLVFQGVSDTERSEFKKGSYHWIPDVVVDFNKESWIDELTATLKGTKEIRYTVNASVFNYGKKK